MRRKDGERGATKSPLKKFNNSSLKNKQPSELKHKDMKRGRDTKNGMREAGATSRQSSIMSNHHHSTVPGLSKTIIK